MQTEILLTLRLQERLFADPRRITLLKQIAHTGSISQGARLAGISYKSAWDAINEMNHLSEHTLVERATGGKGGGGALLTRYGERLIQLFDLLTQIQQKAFNSLNDDALPPGSLLAAISRFSLQTSARNQWFGTVVSSDNNSLQPQVEILLADGSTRIRAAITGQSAARLALDAGKEVLVLIKAPWISLTRGPHAAAQADNQLTGVVTQIDSANDVHEVLVRLPDGQILCAMLSKESFDAVKPEEGAEVTAFFNADRVIIATLC